MEFFIIGIVSALNLILIVHKFKKGRVEDGIFDTIFFICVTVIFGGSYAGMVVAMIASLIISIYLLVNPPTFFRELLNKPTVKQSIKTYNSELWNLEPLKSSTEKAKDRRTQ